MRCPSHSLSAVLLCLALCLGGSGCVPVMIAGAGVVGGYAISRDTFEGVSSKSQEELWDAANRVASIMGTVENSDRRGNQITALISGARVSILVLPVNLTTTKLRIKARKNIFPAIDIAQNVYTKIMNQLEG